MTSRNQEYYERKKKTDPEWVARRAARAIAWKLAHPEEYRKRNRAGVIRRRYGLTQEDLDRLLALQDGRCSICRTQFGSTKGSRMCIDHDHQTGQFRGLLCDNCNRMIARDNPTILIAGADYLKRHGK